MPNIPPAYRRWLYMVTAAVIPVLVVYDVISNEVAPLWASLAAAILGTTSGALAAVNTPKKETDDDTPQ